jgi:hypothetical protein
MWYMTSQKNGVSALDLQRVLGLGSYRTAWLMLHKLRRAMVRPGRDRLQGTVEVDEAYWGGAETGGATGRLTLRKTIIAVAAQQAEYGIGRISAASLPSASKTKHWYIISGVEVEGDHSSRYVVVLGDSITDERGSTDDGNNRWPDVLAERLMTNTPTAGVGVVNMRIGGNAIFGGLGPAAVKRFDRDVLEPSGVRYFILFEGVNDIGSSTRT